MHAYEKHLTYEGEFHFRVFLQKSKFPKLRYVVQILQWCIDEIYRANGPFFHQCDIVQLYILNPVTILAPRDPGETVITGGPSLSRFPFPFLSLIHI